MSTIKLLSLIFTIACVTQRIQAYAGRGSYSQYWKKSDQKIASYMGCDIKDRFRYDSDFLQPICNITIEIPNSYGSIERLSCNIDRPPFITLLNLYYEISAVVKPDIVILYGTGKNWAKIRIVRMRECRYRDVYVDVDRVKEDDFGTAEINVRLNDNTFNVFYEDKQECPSGVCVDAYDFSGKFLEGPYDVARPTDNQNKNKVTYVFGERYGGNISLIYDYENIKLVLYQEKNASKILFQLTRHNVTVLSVSTQNKLFGLCYRWNRYRKAACLQYDDQGNEIVNASFYYPRGWTSLRVTNRYEGGFTAMASTCTIDNCHAERDIYQVEIKEKELKYRRPIGYIPRVCRSRVGDKREIETGFDYATYLNCKPNIHGQSYTFMLKSWCSEFIKCSPVIL